MLQLSASLINRPVMSLRTGAAIGQTLQPIINPNNLKIEGFYCQDKFSKSLPVLLVQDIRDFIQQGMVVNDQDALTDPTELIRLKDILELNFELIGKPVFTTSKEKLGKIVDYATDNKSFYIQKIYVGQSLLKSFSNGQLSVDRAQIIEITNKRIVIQDPLQPTKATVSATAQAAIS